MRFQRLGTTKGLWPRLLKFAVGMTAVGVAYSLLFSDGGTGDLPSFAGAIIAITLLAGGLIHLGQRWLRRTATIVLDDEGMRCAGKAVAWDDVTRVGLADLYPENSAEPMRFLLFKVDHPDRVGTGDLMAHSIEGAVLEHNEWADVAIFVTDYSGSPETILGQVQRYVHDAQARRRIGGDAPARA